MDIAIRQFSENIILKILAYSARFDERGCVIDSLNFIQNLLKCRAVIDLTIIFQEAQV